jgi:hypothetical protein
MPVSTLVCALNDSRLSCWLSERHMGQLGHFEFPGHPAVWTELQQGIVHASTPRMAAYWLTVAVQECGSKQMLAGASIPMPAQGMADAVVLHAQHPACPHPSLSNTVLPHA